MIAATHQPHAEELRAGDRRRRIRAALAAARHASLGQVRHAGRARDRDGARRPAHHRRARRDLQSARRPLAALDRHGRELHGAGGEAAERASSPRSGARVQREASSQCLSPACSCWMPRFAGMTEKNDRSTPGSGPSSRCSPRRTDRAQRDAARADRDARHGRRDACALPVRLSVRADLPARRAAGDRRRRCRGRRWSFWPWAARRRAVRRSPRPR